jgi:O-antigen/teichoic acid export membrane protein
MSIRRNTIYNLVGALLPLAVSLFTVPVYLKLIGEERFGILAIIWVLLGYFGLFDLGLSQATAQHIAKLKDAEPRERTETFWTALSINAGFGVCGGVLIWPFAYIFFDRYFQVNEGLRPEILASIPWLIAAVPVATISGVLSGTLQGRERFLALNAISLLGTVMFQILPLIVAWLVSPALTWLLPTALLSRVLSFSLLFSQCRQHLPLTGTPILNHDLVEPLLRFGGWVTITGVIGPLLEVLDRVVIGALAGARAVTFYVVPFSLSNRVTILSSSMAAALFPRLASATGDERERISTLAVRTLEVAITPLIIIGLFIMEPFLTWWLSAEFAAHAVLVGQILLLGLWANCFARIPYTRLQAQGRPDLVAKAHLAELLPYLCLLYIALSLWGIVGAALAWSVRVAVDCLLMFALSRVPLKFARLFVVPVILVIVAAIGAIAAPCGSLTFWVVGSVALFMSLLWGWHNAPASLGLYLPEPLRNLMPKET